VYTAATPLWQEEDGEAEQPDHAEASCRVYDSAPNPQSLSPAFLTLSAPDRSPVISVEPAAKVRRVSRPEMVDNSPAQAAAAAVAAAATAVAEATEEKRKRKLDAWLALI